MLAYRVATDHMYKKLDNRMKALQNPTLPPSDLLVAYRDCIALLKGLTAQDVAIAALSYRFQIRRAVLDPGDGRYSDKTARDTLNTILEALDDGSELVEVRNETMYRLAVLFTRLGEYDKAYGALTSLQRGVRFQDTEQLLSSQSMGPTRYNDPMIDVNINTNRLLALLRGYYGEFTLASQLIEKAERQCSNFHLARHNGFSPLPTPNLTNAPPMVAISNPGLMLLTPGITPGITPQLQTSTRRMLPEIPINTTVLYTEIQLVKAKLAMLQGPESSALALISPVLRRLESHRHFGTRHILTLEAASLRAEIVSRISSPDAEATCSASLEATTTCLSDDHPLAMEGLSTLADVLLARSRPYEVLDTVFYLRSRAKDKLGESHPQTMRYWFQVGEANLSVGNYAKARAELQGLYAVANKKWGGKTSQEGLGRHPDVPRYLARLAMAKCLLEKLEEAEQDAYRALLWQLEIFWPSIEIEDEGLGPVLATVISVVESNTIDPEVVSPHPHLLECLTICSAILDRRTPETGHEIRRRILTLVGNKRAARYSEAHHLTLSTNLELAFNRLEEGEDGDNSEDSAQPDIDKGFHRIFLDCERSLGPNHILTWRARLGRLFTSRDIDPILDAAKFKQEASGIMNEQVVLMGEYHPLVLDSRWRLFVFKLLVYRNENAHETGSRLLDSLRRKEIRQERLMESLQLEEKVARIYAVELSDYEHGLPIINDLLEYLDTVPWEDEFCKKLEAFSLRVCELLDLVAQQALKEFKRDSNNKGSDAVLGIPVFLGISQELAEKYGDNIHNRVGGLLILGRLLQQPLRGSTGNNSPDRLANKLNSSFHKWKTSLATSDSDHEHEQQGSMWARGKVKVKSKGKGKGEKKVKSRAEREDLESGW